MGSLFDDGYARVVIHGSVKSADLQISGHIACHSSINDVGLHHLGELLGSISDEAYSLAVWRIEVAFSSR